MQQRHGITGKIVDQIAEIMLTYGDDEVILQIINGDCRK
jgi:hypothetical protein